MPLSKRQKRRLLEVSKMIESSIVVKDDMEEIQLEYSQEIEKLVKLIADRDKPEQPEVEGDVSPPVVTKTMKTVQIAREKRKQKQREQEARNNYVPPSKPDVPDAPEWAKRLWKSIAKKCHPDRLSFQDLTAIQIARRQIWFLEAKSLFENRSWPKLIHIGVQVGEYVEEINHREQLTWLSDEYNAISEKITAMQDSLAWKWGTNWEDVNLRINIITAVLNHQGVQVPPRERIIQLLAEIELD